MPPNVRDFDRTRRVSAGFGPMFCQVLPGLDHTLAISAEFGPASAEFGQTWPASVCASQAHRHTVARVPRAGPHRAQMREWPASAKFGRFRPLCPNLHKRVGPAHLPGLPTFGRFRPKWTRCWGNFGPNFCHSLPHLGERYRSVARSASNLSGTDRLRPEFGPTLARIWPTLASLSQVKAISTNMWPESPNYGRLRPNWTQCRPVFQPN